MPALCCVLGASAADLKTVQPADIANIRKVTDPQISPDGRAIAYVLETPVKAGDQRNAHVWLVGKDGAEPAHPFLLSAQSDTSPRWSPDGKVIAFLSDRANPLAHLEASSFTFRLLAEGRPDLGAWAYKEDPHKEESHQHDQQIWAIRFAGGEAYPLTDIPGGVKSFKWSRDGKSIGFVRTDAETKSEKDRKAAKYDQVLIDRDYKFDRLWIYDLAKCTARLVTKDDENIDDFDWSPDGKRILARISPTPRLNDYWYVSKVAILDSDSGNITQTVTGSASPEHVHWLRNGDKISYGIKTAKEIAETPVLEDLSTGKKVEYGAHFKATIHSSEWDPDGASLTIQGVEGTRTFFAKANAATGEIKKLIETPAEGYGFTMSDDGATIAYLGQTPARPDDVWIYSAKDGAKALTNANPQAAGWKLGRVQEVSWTSSKDHRKIYGVLVLPPGYTPGTPHKTIVHAHGGPFEAWQSGWLGTWYEWAVLLASHDYVVLAPNPRGSQGQGNEFQEANYKDWGGGDYQDVMDGVDMLVKQKIADPEKLGIGGWSYGGFMTSWTITHTNRFKAAVVGAAVTDLYGMSTTTDISPNFLTEFFGSFVADKKLYDDRSPMRFIENCHTPALVLHGASDVRVPVFQGEEFYHALRLFNREADMVTYPREPHVFAEREHQIDSLQRIIDWFDTHLK